YHSEKDLKRLLYFLKKYRNPQFPEYHLYYTLVYFLSHTGLRIREALALQWEDLNGQQLTINKEIAKDTNATEKVTPLEKQFLNREITLDKKAVDVLRKFERNQSAILKSNQAFKPHPKDIIFQNDKGKYLDPSVVRKKMKRFCFNANVDFKG